MGFISDQRCGKLNHKDPHFCVYLSLQTERDVDVIRVDESNTVKSLRDKLQSLLNSGNDDSGFPILRPDDRESRLVGYIGASELEHALSTFFSSLFNERYVLLTLSQLSWLKTQIRPSHSTRRLLTVTVK